MEEKCISWKLIRSCSCNRFFIQYELNVSLDIIEQLIRDNIIYRYEGLYNSNLGLNHDILMADLDEYIKKFKSSTKMIKMISLSTYYGSKYPYYGRVIHDLFFSAIAYNLHKRFTEGNIITYRVGKLGFDEIDHPDTMNNLMAVILYIWKHA